MERKVTYNTFQALRPLFDTLAKAGYFKVVLKSLSPRQKIFYKIHRIFMWSLIALYNLLHIIRVIKERHDTDKVVDTLFILLTTLSMLGKQLAFNLNSRRIDDIISALNGPIFSPKTPFDVEVMKENAVAMHRLLKFFITTVFICIFLWATFPIVNRAMGVEVELTCYFPFDTNVPGRFEIVVICMHLALLMQAYGNVAMDCTIVSFYAQVKVQLRILKNNLEHLVDEDDEQHKDKRSLKHDFMVNEENVTANLVIQKRFTANVLHYKKLLWFVGEIESVFAEAMLFQFFVTAWGICMTMYKMVGLSVTSVESISMMMYICCLMVQLFIYCYYGTQVKYESEFVNQSIYFGDWLSLSPLLRRQLLLMMTNYTRPITPRTAFIVYISLDTYITVIRASYTLFTFLSQRSSI